MYFLVAIRCPRTGEEVPTGIETNISDFATLPKGETPLLCPACGHTHMWSRKDMFLAHSMSGLEGHRPHKANTREPLALVRIEH
jgi:hypothetical protein